MGKLNITFCSQPDFASNAKPLYDYMIKEYSNKMNFSWVVNTKEMYEKLTSLGIETYLIRTDEFFEHMKRVDVIFSTHCNLMGYKKKGTLYVELWHGISSKNVGFLGEKISKQDEEWYSYAKRQIDYLIVPSDFWRVIFSTRFNIKYNRILSLGYPKLDNFVYSNAKENLSYILGVDVSLYRKIIYYMPTYRSGCGREKSDSELNEKNILNLDYYDEDELEKYLSDNNFLLCIKKHPDELKKMYSFKESKNIKIIEEKNISNYNITLNDILNAADIMITDYSSLGIEFIMLDKPVIYLTRDIEEYSKNRGITFKDMDFWMPGYKVCNLSDLKKSINNCLEENYKFNNEMKEKKKLWFSNLNDGGCNNICNFLFKDDKLSENVKYYVDREEELEYEVKDNEYKINNLNIEIENLNRELNKVFNSKGWKFLERVRKIKKIFKK